MREVVIQSWCDECAANNEDVPAEPIDITWRNREVSLDLCEEHAAPFREVERLIDTYAHQTTPRQVKKKKKANGSDQYRTADGKYECPECGFHAVNPQGLGAHRRHHN